jgi:hypothetical protein
MFNKKFARSFPVSKCKWWYLWNLFWWKIEGYDLLNGINVYRQGDENSAGFVIKFGSWAFRCRYSKRTCKWNIGFKRYIGAK